MKALAMALAATLVGALSTPSFAQNVNLRGTVTAFDGKVVSMKARDGRDLQVEVPDNVAVAITQPLKLADLKQGQSVGVTTVKRPDGQLVAIDVRPIPPTATLGLSPYDLQPDSTMTNATLEGTVQSSGGQEITLNFKTGTVKVLVPENTPMSRSAPGQRTDIKPGVGVYVVARPSPDGRMTAVRMQVGKDGVNPTQ